ncbi:hypothetical protein R0K18_35070, partial [Pantoea sp. SIMBA_133]
FHLFFRSWNKVLRECCIVERRENRVKTRDWHEKDPDIENVYFNEIRVGIANVYFNRQESILV